MRNAAIVGLSAGLVMALNVCATQASTPASQMVAELQGAASKCSSISFTDHLQQQLDEQAIQNAIDLSATGGSKSAVDDAFAASQAKRKASMEQFGACLSSAKETGKSAYKKYRATPDQPQKTMDDVKAVFIAWLTYLPDLSTFGPSGDSPQSADYQKALSTLEVDDVAN